MIVIAGNVTVETRLIDRLARGLLGAMQEDLQAYLGGPLEPDLVSELYLRVERLEKCTPA